MQNDNRTPIPRTPEGITPSGRRIKPPRKPSAVPIYITGALFLILTSSWNLTRPMDFIRLAVTCGLTYFLSGKIFRGRKLTAAEIAELDHRRLASRRANAKLPKQPKPPLPTPPPSETTPSTGDPELDALLAEGKLAIAEMGKLRRACENRDVEVKILKIEQISQKILDNAVDDRRDIPRTRKFLTYYLPTTLKLLHAYDRMSEQSIDGENISATVKRIEDMLDDIIVAYNRQLDAMFSDEALDIETDIRVLEATMKREGLR
jgi:hypothetical protein